MHKLLLQKRGFRSKNTSMTKIYRVTFDSFKQSYEGYFSSLDRAAELLPTCRDFLRALRWELPRPDSKPDADGVIRDLDWQSLENIQPEIIIHEDRLRVILRNVQINLTKRFESPEVKTPGEPYIPAKTSYEKLPPEFKDIEPCRTIYYQEIFLDYAKDQ